MWAGCSLGNPGGKEDGADNAGGVKCNKERSRGEGGEQMSIEIQI